ncbi:MAG: PQQ-binding-like beta-propeller repeat protein [Planctomycetes bacterium]|nr:PQQ-binding-like beta-propeller repeat protein [Planctomycetota bacterium]
MSHSTPREMISADGRLEKKVPDDELARVRFRELWTSNVGSSIEQLWYLGGDLYLTTKGTRTSHRLIKVSGSSGKIEWAFDLTGRPEFRPTVYEYPEELARERELWLVQNDRLHCLDDAYGLELYNIDTKVSVSTPCEVGPERVFIGTWDHRVYGFGKASRIHEWTYLTDAPVVAAPTLAKLMVYAGSEDGQLYAFNEGAGYQEGESWVHRTGGKIVNSPCCYRDRIYVGSWDYKLYCLEEFRGLTRWAYPSGAPVVSGVFPFKDSVFATIRDDRNPQAMTTSVIALNADTGDLQWERKGLDQVLAADAIHCLVLDGDRKLHGVRHTDGQTDWQLDVSRYAFVLGQDARQGAERERWGRLVLATRDGIIQSIQPKR